MNGYIVIRRIILTTIFVLLSACNTTPTLHPSHGLPVDQMLDVVRDGINNDRRLMANRTHIPTGIRKSLITPSLQYIKEDNYRSRERRFNVQANKADAKSFFMSLVNNTKHNMIVNSQVKGTISIDLKNVTIDETLEAVRDGYGYEFRKTSYGYEIFPQKLETKMFTVNYLNVKRSGKTMTEMTSGQITETVSGSSSGSNSNSGSPSSYNAERKIPSGTTVDTRTLANFWRDLTLSLKDIVGTKDGRSVATNPNAGVVIVRAYPNEIRAVSRYLERIESNMNRQVILEAKVLEVQLNDQFQSGIDWNAFGKVVLGEGGIGATAFERFEFTAPPVDDFSSIFTMRINGNFGMMIKLLQTQGNVQILSSPHISTLNNQKAIIKVGQDEFFVTGISSSNSGTTGTLNNNYYPSENIELTPFFSGITLDVTPQISRDGEIILHIHPTVSKVQDQEKKIVLGNGGTVANTNTFVLPLAQSTIRESDTVVRAKSGQVIVIGGLMQNQMVDQVAGVPYLSRLPVVGPLFRRTQQISQKIELVILLKPVIANNSTFIGEMKGMHRTLQHVRRGGHISGLPEVFGNEGEKIDAVRQGLFPG